MHELVLVHSSQKQRQGAKLGWCSEHAMCHLGGGRLLVDELGVLNVHIPLRPDGPVDVTDGRAKTTSGFRQVPLWPLRWLPRAARVVRVPCCFFEQGT